MKNSFLLYLFISFFLFKSNCSNKKKLFYGSILISLIGITLKNIYSEKQFKNNINLNKKNNNQDLENINNEENNDRLLKIINLIKEYNRYNSSNIFYKILNFTKNTFVNKEIKISFQKLIDEYLDSIDEYENFKNENLKINKIEKNKEILGENEFNNLKDGANINNYKNLKLNENQINLIIKDNKNKLKKTEKILDEDIKAGKQIIMNKIKKSKKECEEFLNKFNQKSEIYKKLKYEFDNLFYIKLNNKLDDEKNTFANICSGQIIFKIIPLNSSFTINKVQFLKSINNEIIKIFGNNILNPINIDYFKIKSNNDLELSTQFNSKYKKEELIALLNNKNKNELKNLIKSENIIKSKKKILNDNIQFMQNQKFQIIFNLDTQTILSD